MATTALVVEILVAGLLALAWLLVIPAIFLFPAEAQSVAETLKEFSDYSLVLGGIVLAAAYTLGWLVNGITYLVAHLTYRKSLQHQVIGRSCTESLYKELRTTVLLDTSCEEVVKRLNAQTSVHRIARAGGLNFVALGTMVFILSDSSAGSVLGAGLLILGLSFWWVAIDWHREYMSLMRSAAVRSEAGKKLVNEAGERSLSLPERWRLQIRAWLRGLARGASREVAVVHVGDATNQGPQADG